MLLASSLMILLTPGLGPMICSSRAVHKSPPDDAKVALADLDLPGFQFAPAGSRSLLALDNYIQCDKWPIMGALPAAAAAQDSNAILGTNKDVERFQREDKTARRMSVLRTVVNNIRHGRSPFAKRPHPIDGRPANTTGLVSSLKLRYDHHSVLASKNALLSRLQSELLHGDRGSASRGNRAKHTTAMAVVRLFDRLPPSLTRWSAVRAVQQKLLRESTATLARRLDQGSGRTEQTATTAARLWSRAKGQLKQPVQRQQPGTGDETDADGYMLLLRLQPGFSRTQRCRGASVTLVNLGPATESVALYDVDQALWAVAELCVRHRYSISSNSNSSNNNNIMSGGRLASSRSGLRVDVRESMAGEACAPGFGLLDSDEANDDGSNGRGNDRKIKAGPKAQRSNNDRWRPFDVAATTTLTFSFLMTWFLGFAVSMIWLVHVI